MTRRTTRPARRWTTATAAVLVLAASLSACSDSPDVSDVVPDSETLKIGVNGLQPGLSYVSGEGYAGFDIDVAAYVADKLGWDSDEVEFVQLPTAERVSALQDGTVDMVVAAFSITEDRQADVDFAGPYFTAGQDLLVRKGSYIAGPSSLNGRTVCANTGSTGLTRIADEYSANAQIREADSTAACVDLLIKGEVDAVTTDNVILAGFAAQNPDKIEVVGAPFSTEQYGIGLPKGSPDVGVVNDIIVDMVMDGSWQKSIDGEIAGTSFLPPNPPIRDEG